MAETAGGEAADETMILVIGNLRNWEREGRPVPELEGFRFASFADLDQEHLADPVPDVVLSALMGENFDAIDVARRLAELGYAGRYRALSNAIPSTETIREEIREVAPDLDFDLFLLRPGGVV
jgi:hypothetical protein